jgi:hypothetical protein
MDVFPTGSNGSRLMPVVGALVVSHRRRTLV